MAYAGPGFFYTDPIFIRSGQQTVVFNLGPSAGASSANVRVNEGSWISLASGGPSISWSTPPTSPGQYNIEFKYVGPGNPQGKSVPFTLTVVPGATSRFGDGAGNTIDLG